MSRLWVLTVTSLVIIASTAPAVAQPASGPIEIQTAAEGRKTITPDWQKINAQPLGSKGNPVRADGPAGERAYMQRLRCANGTVIDEKRRVGAAGVGPYTTMVSVWEVECYGELHVVHIDGAHPGHVERRAARGFSIRDP
jgi:hypothetical protein